MNPTNPSPYSFIYHFSKDPGTHESLIHHAMTENPKGSEDEIYNDMTKEKPFLKQNEKFNELFSEYYQRKTNKRNQS